MSRFFQNFRVMGISPSTWEKMVLILECFTILFQITRSFWFQPVFLICRQQYFIGIVPKWNAFPRFCLVDLKRLPQHNSSYSYNLF